MKEKEVLALFLDTAGDYLGDGYWRTRQPPRFEDDVPSLDAASGPALPAGARSGQSGGGFSGPMTPPLKPGDTLEKIAAEVRSCTGCGLCDLRILAVPGEGAAHPLVLVLGEAPGAEEDETGRPFVGKAGKLLDKMLASIGLSRAQNCFIANTVKCRPPGNRDPQAEETAVCAPFLSRQMAILQPKFILCVGRIAAQTLLNTTDGIGKLRGRFFDYTPAASSPPIPLIATYHPSALLRDESLKRPAWEDLKQLKARLDG